VSMELQENGKYKLITDLPRREVKHSWKFPVAR